MSLMSDIVPLLVITSCLSACTPPSPATGTEPANDAAPDRAPPVDSEMNQADATPADASVDSAPVDATLDVTADAGPVDVDASMSDGSPPPTVDDCATACTRVSTCHGDGAAFDADDCRQRCRWTEASIRRSWFRCVNRQTCEAVVDCGVPPAPPTCAETCDGMASCAGLDLTACLDACTDARWSFGACGRSVVGQCEADEALQCLAFTTLDGCRTVCDTAALCTGIDEIPCRADCIRRRLSSDPLAVLFTRHQTRCVSWRSADCDDIERCMDPALFDDGPPGTRFALCTAWAACDDPRPCAAIFADLGVTTARSCAVDALGALCGDQRPDADTIDLVLRRCRDELLSDPIAEGCALLVEAGEACDVPVPTEETCAGAPEVPVDTTRRARIGLRCLAAASCGDLAACIETATDVGVCDDHCARLDACDATEDGCRDACVAAWPYHRQQRHEACYREADGCPEDGLCDPLPAPPCAEFCAALDACDLAPADCPRACDDDDLFAPGAHEALRRCVADAADCQTVGDCLP